MTNDKATEIGNLDHLAEDSRRACFQQGKACVYEPENEPGVIVTEWPNGTVDRQEAGSNVETRTWPDGSTETLPTGRPVEFPHWPHDNEADGRRCPS